MLSLLAGLWLGAPAAAEEPVPAPDAATARAWIESFKTEPRGPFEAIRWFCADGTVHPAKPYPCEERGGGIQHGDWNDRARALREGGYTVANVLAELDPEAFVGDEADRLQLAEILLERFLIGWDDGWIFRRARSYRGALQSEDEAAGARRLLLAMLADPGWIEPASFFLLRETARLLPLEAERGVADEVRLLARELAEADPAFETLRAKIHGAPAADDASRVRAHAARARGGLADDYERLAGAIDRLFAFGGSEERLSRLVARMPDGELAGRLRNGRDALRAAAGPREVLTEGAGVLIALREAVAEVGDPALRLAVLEASLAVEQEVFAAGSLLATGLARESRAVQLDALVDAARALHGTGLLGRRHLSAVKASRTALAVGPLRLELYAREIRQLARAPEWAARWIAFHFEPALQKLAPIEPLVHLYPQDRLRSSALLLVGAVADRLTLDANRLAGVEHRVFGAPVGAGLRPLNPGIARGVLREPSGPEAIASLPADSIALLPETTADLPPVAGILTRGEGSSLSHVQLLARNLGIPNVVVGDEWIERLRGRLGEATVLAVSPGGIVRLEADGPRFDAVFEEASSDAGDVLRIEPDLDKLDLGVVEPLGLDEVSSEDSGRVCGPKAANLGELRRHFGTTVPDAVVIPFGVFRHLLERPHDASGQSMWEHMRERYAAIAAAPPRDRDALVRPFLAGLRAWIAEVPLPPELLIDLREELERRFGADGSFGVFVRSDTNVEDLPGFTGAGLNLTVPNVVGFASIVEAIRAVWASPFTERAYSWRQAHMSRPEYVFPAVLLQRAFPAEKSGVMVTVDVDDGSRDFVSIAVNEGVGGAVEGQASESLRVPRTGGRVRFLSQATAATRAVLSPAGGIVRRPATGSEEVLKRDELIQLVELARRVEDFPALRRAEGGTAPADVEFAFRDGRLALLQLRPFVESRRARRNALLRELDAGSAARAGREVDLARPPVGANGPGPSTVEDAP